MKVKYDPEDYEAFIYQYFSKHLTSAIKDFHQEWMKLLKEKRVTIAAPRNHAKSTVFSKFYSIYMALENPGCRIILISKTARFAEEKLLLPIRNELDKNEELKRDYGAQNKKGKWSEHALHLDNGSTIETRGSGQQIRGDRADIIICDDIESEEMINSDTQTSNFDAWFYKDVVGVCDVDTQLVVVGTIIDNESFLSKRVHQPTRGWKTSFFQAMKGEWNWDGQRLTGDLLWPERFTHQFFEDIILGKTEDDEGGSGLYYFLSEYMNEPIPADKRIFQEAWFNYFEEPPENCLYFSACDPAGGLGKRNDSTAIVTCAVDEASNIYVVDVMNSKLLPHEIINKIFETYERWHPVVIGIETRMYGTLLKGEVENQRSRRNQYPVIKELSDGNVRKHLRIETLQPRFQAGKIFIKQSQYELIQQLKRFPSRRSHDDIIDALAYILDIMHVPTALETKLHPHSWYAAAQELREAKRETGAWGNQNIITKGHY